MPIRFDFGAADDMGQALAQVRCAVQGDLGARTASAPLLETWSGSFRAGFDEQRHAGERTMNIEGVAGAIAALRRAWDDAADAQRRANQAVSLDPPRLRRGPTDYGGAAPGPR